MSRREIWLNLLQLSSRLSQVWPVESDHLPSEMVSLLAHVGGLRDALVDAAAEDVGQLIDEMDRFVFTATEAWGLEPILTEALPLETLIAEL